MVITVANLRVNNSSADSQVKIIGAYPTISWDYARTDRVVPSSTNQGTIDSIYKVSPLGFEIRIATSALSLGTNAFPSSGSIISTGFITNATSSWRFRGTVLTRGTKYYGQIRISDADNNVSVWKTFSFAYNTLPVISSASITPSLPTIHDDLLLSYSFTDADGDHDDTAKTKIWWFRNGVHERQFDGKTLIESKFLGFSDAWSVQIFPSDGSEFGQPFVTTAVSVTSTIPTVSNAIIIPEQPTYNDPLQSKYIFSSADAKKDSSVFRWYVNGQLITDKITSFVRLSLIEGDIVHYDIKPNDGEIDGPWLSSTSVTITSPPYVVSDLRCNGEAEPLSITLSPSLSWTVNGPNATPTLLSVIIGTAPGSNNIYDSGVINSIQSVYVLSEGVLENGRDYFISVAVGGSKGLNGYTTIHARTVGSRWQEKVSNSIGWTIETTLKVISISPLPTDSSSSSSSSSTTYQGIRIYDGTRFAEVRIYTDRVALVASSTMHFLSNGTEYATYTIVGKGNDIKVYRNYQLIIDGTATMISVSNSKLLEFGAVGNSPYTLGEYLNFYYTTAGSYEPSSSAYFATKYETYLSVEGSIDYISGENTDVYYSVSNFDSLDSSTVYKLTDEQKPEFIKPTRDTNLVMNSIQTSNDGRTAYFCHNNGLTVFNSKSIPAYDNEVGVENPSIRGWRITQDSTTQLSIVGGIVIDTSTGGKLYFSQSEKGSKWFDIVDNKKGWTVAFSMKVFSLADDVKSSATDKPDGFGIYVNDGTYQEVVHFFTDQIVFRNSDSYAAFDTTISTEYVLVGKGRSITLYYKGDNGKYHVLNDGNMIKVATTEGNGGRPSVAEDLNGNLHAVWHDDGSINRSLYYSMGTKTNGVVNWGLPSQITSDIFDASNASIAVDNFGTIYIAFESLRSDATDISMVVKNIFGWSKPFLLNSGQYQAYSPKMVIDDNNDVHLVWEDHRDVVGAVIYMTRSFATGKWSNLATLTTIENNSFSPSITQNSGRLYVAYTVRYNSGISDIWVTSKQIGNASWDASVIVSSSSHDADFADIVAYNDQCFIVWHENSISGYEIYARIMLPNLTFTTTASRLTNQSSACRFPSVGVRTGSDSKTGNAYVAFEYGGDLDNDGFTTIDTAVMILYYDHNLGIWLASNQTHVVGLTTYGGTDVDIVPNDIRQLRRPAMPKLFSDASSILYEAEFATADNEYIIYVDKFVGIRSAYYDLTYAPTYSLLDAERDRFVSGHCERKELRFGDFSDNYSGKVSFQYIKYLASEAVGPFQATLLLEGSQINDAAVNNSGDGWIAALDGLSFYFNEDSRVSKFKQGLFGVGPVLDVGFDYNNVMYVVAAGNIYISYDHLNFYPAFTYITNAKSIAFDSQNFLWVASSSGVYKVDVFTATVNLPRQGSNIIQPPVGSTSSSSSAPAPIGVAGGNEIKSDLTSGQNHYAFVLSPNLQVWNNSTSAFETPVEDNWTDYAITMTETAIPGTFTANFPTAITIAALYFTYIYLRSGSTPVSTDTKLQQGEVDWDGTKERGYVPQGEITPPPDIPPSNPDVFACVSDPSLGYSTFTTSCGMPSNNAKKIYVDSLDQVWIATSSGLALIKGSQLSVFTSGNSGVPSDDIRDIAIVNSAVRYIATTSGIARMLGNGFEKITFSDPAWSENATAIAWRSPNTLWVGAGGKIMQLNRESITGEYTFVSFDAADYANFDSTCKNSQRFNFDSLDTSFLLQVLVNGRIVRDGYRISSNTLVFDSPLLDSDSVQIAVRKDIEKWTTLQQNKAELAAYGEIFRDLKKFSVDGNSIYGITDGDKGQVVIFDSSIQHFQPYDSIVLDTTPPTGTLTFVEQIDATTVRLKITDAIDNLSGIKEMKVSNHPNLTSDGTTAQPWVPFRTDFQFNLGSDLGNIFTQLEFSATTGRRLSQFGTTLYAGCANPAQIFQFNTTTKAWALIATLDESVPSTSIEFMVQFRNAFYIGTSSNLGGKLWSSANGTIWKKVIDYPGNAKASTILNNILYVGTGGVDGGQLYTFDGVNSSRIANKVGATIYALHGAKDAVYIGTGEAGIIYKWDTTVNRLILVSHDRDTEITAIGSALIEPLTSADQHPDPDFFLFAGTGTAGRIIKSVNNAPFNISLTSLPTKVTQLKQDALGQMHAVVGKNIYKYKNRSWTAVYTNKTQVEDIFFDVDGFTLIYSGGIKRINNEKGVKKIYLGLRDVAGNASANESILTDININNLVGFVNQNRIIELNEYGERIWSYEGTNPFYSADKVTVEEGEYFSEIFNGTSDLVTWDSIYWDAVVPDGTDLRIAIRTANSRSELLLAKFTKTFQKEDFAGGDLSNLSGQFIQFKVIMTTSVRDKTPKLYRINIRSLTRTSVHFFTTNFVLPSRLKGGLMTAQTFVPFAADVVFGINTNDSTDFQDYQIVKPDQLFSTDFSQSGKNLRIGIKIISPLSVKIVTDEIDEEYSPYLGELWTNVIPFSFTNTASTAKSYFFKVELFEEPDLAHVFSTLYTATNPSAFAIGGAAISDTGIVIQPGGTVNVLAALKGNATIRCNQYYYTKVSAVTGTTSTVVDDAHVFIANCHPNYDSAIGIDFINSGTTNSFHFRAMFYADATRTTLVKTYFSGHDVGGWTINGLNLSSGGANVTHGQSVDVGFKPNNGDLTDDTYFLVIDYYDGTIFHNITKSPTIVIKSTSKYTCSEYTNVPIIRDVAIQIELEDFTESFGSKDRTRRTVQFNI